MPLPEYHPDALSRTAFHFLDGWRDEDIFDLAPPYQRTSVWTDQQRRQLIRSLQMGLPVGSIWTNRRDDAADVPYGVVDGKQRIETLRRWFAGGLTVPADWFALRPYEADRGYPPALRDGHPAQVCVDDLTDVGQRRCRNWRVAELSVHGLDLAGEAELFLLVNAAGTTHTAADLARAAAVSRGLTETAAARLQPGDWFYLDPSDRDPHLATSGLKPTPDDPTAGTVQTEAVKLTVRPDQPVWRPA